MLRQLVASLQQQLADSNRKVDALLQEVAELKELLVQKTQEEQKHMELIKHMDKASEHWQDIVIDIRDEVRMGHLQGKSIKDQEMLIKTIIAKDRSKEQTEVIKVTAE